MFIRTLVSSANLLCVLLTMLLCRTAIHAQTVGTFVGVTPCRLVDTRENNLGSLGAPALVGMAQRDFALLAGTCGLPTGVIAYSLNFTAVPREPFSYLTVWPTGQAQPLVSTLNAYTGTVTTNAAIVPAGTDGKISVFVTGNTDLIIDVNGYFAQPSTQATDQLGQQLNQLQRQVTTLTDGVTQATSLAQQIANTAQQLTQVQQQVASLSSGVSQAAALGAQVTESSQALAQAQQRITSLSTDVAQANALGTQVAQTSQQLSQVQQQLTGLSAGITQANALSTQLSQATQQISQVQQQVSTLSASVTQAVALNTQIIQANQQVSQLQQQVTNLGAGVTQANALNQQVSTLASQLSQAQQQLASLNTSVGQLPTLLSSVNQIVSALQIDSIQRNVAVGSGAALSGASNTTLGDQSMHGNSGGNSNTAIGAGSLAANTTGNDNVSIGKNALGANLVGSFNIAIGSQSGSMVSGGDNIIEIGNQGQSGDSATIRIGTQGTHQSAYVAGIYGTGTDPYGTAVLVDDTGMLGTFQSSARYKEDVKEIGDPASENLMRLRPVEFRYKRPSRRGDKPVQYGLIAEEVEKVFPNLVVHDSQGRAETVQYHQLPALLLSELQKQRRLLEEQGKQILEQATQIRRLSSRNSAP